MSYRSHKKAVAAVSMKPAQFKPSKWLLKQKKYLSRVNKMTTIIEDISDDEDMLKMKAETKTKKESRNKPVYHCENDTTKESRQKRRDYHKKLAELKAAGLFKKF